MTETQAKSGSAGTSANPVEEEASSGGATAAGRAAVGRATVPADAPSPKFTRAPGMPPPPDQPGGEADSRPTPAQGGADGGAPTSATAKVTPAKAAADRAEPSASAGRAKPEATRPSPGRPSTGTPSPFGSRTSAARSVSDPAGGNVVGPVGGGAAAVGAARVNEAVRAARSSVSSAASRGPRRARLNLKRIDPWSVMKFSFAVSLVLFIVIVVATAVLYLALDAMGVFESVNNSLTDLLSATGGQEADSLEITAKGVILTSVLLGLVNVVLFTALATLGAFVYNVCADLVGGIELTLAERD
ncbi:DUF3566 domain-containing protein [Micromonospora sp. NPDC003197]